MDAQLIKKFFMYAHNQTTKKPKKPRSTNIFVQEKYEYALNMYMNAIKYKKELKSYIRQLKTPKQLYDILVIFIKGEHYEKFLYLDFFKMIFNHPKFDPNYTDKEGDTILHKLAKYYNSFTDGMKSHVFDLVIKEVLSFPHFNITIKNKAGKNIYNTKKTNKYIKNKMKNIYTKNRNQAKKIAYKKLVNKPFLGEDIPDEILKFLSPIKSKSKSKSKLNECMNKTVKQIKKSNQYKSLPSNISKSKLSKKELCNRIVALS